MATLERILEGLETKSNRIQFQHIDVQIFHVLGPPPIGIPLWRLVRVLHQRMESRGPLIQVDLDQRVISGLRPP